MNKIYGNKTEREREREREREMGKWFRIASMCVQCTELLGLDRERCQGLICECGTLLGVFRECLHTYEYIKFHRMVGQPTLHKNRIGIYYVV